MVIKKHLVHHVYTMPVWDVYYEPVRRPHASTYLYFDIAPGHAELYVDGQYFGSADGFQNGQLQVPVAPGTHRVQLHVDGQAYAKTVDVHPGTSAIVKARLM